MSTTPTNPFARHLAREAQAAAAEPARTAAPARGTSAPAPLRNAAQAAASGTAAGVRPAVSAIASPAAAPQSPAAAPGRASPFSRMAVKDDNPDRDDAGSAGAGLRGRQAMAASFVVEGTIDTMRVFGDWARGQIWTEDKKIYTVIGAPLASLREGLDYRFTGRLSNHPKFGEQIEVSTAEPIIRPNQKAMIKFMAANFDGIGERSAAKMIKATFDAGGVPALEKLRLQLLHEPWEINFDTIGREGVYSSEQKETTVSAFVYRDLATRIGALEGMRDTVLKSLAGYLAGLVVNAAKPAEAAWAELSKDPYSPLSKVPGYGFMTADAIGKLVNIAHDDPMRLAALVAHAVRESCDRQGHVYLSREQLTAGIVSLDRRVRVSDAIRVATEQGTIVVDGPDEHARQASLVDTNPLQLSEPRYYPTQLHEAEVSLAERVSELLMPSTPLVAGARLDKNSPSAQRVLGDIRAAAKPIFGKGLDPTQEEALRRIVSAPTRLHTLTAGPGCGKTALMEVLVSLLPQKQMVFCAPTGKAAKVLSTRLASKGLRATTIHSLLQGSGPGDFKVDETDPLNGDILVIDESSMPDLATADAIFRAVNEDMHVIMLGDIRQLPSIAPGSVLADLLKIPEIDHNQLTITHRNSGGILDVVNEIGRGELNPTNRESVTFSGGLGEPQEQFHEVMACYLDAVAKDRIENVMLMMPKRKGKADEEGWNTTYSNAVLREVLNPNAPKIPGTAFHTNDRVVIRENMSLEQPDADEIDPTGRPGRHVSAEMETEREIKSIRVVNGDTGTIKGFTLDPKNPRNGQAKWIAIDLDDGRRVQLPGAAATALGHAYAMTVHAAQGSEYKQVIMVVTPGTPSFMNRNMLFTGASRARDHLRIFGEDRTLVQVARTPLPARNSALPERIRLALDGDTELPEQPGQDAAARDRRAA